jgi:hypothetical protein
MRKVALRIVSSRTPLHLHSATIAINMHTNLVTIVCVTCAQKWHNFVMLHVHVHHILLVEIVLATDMNSTDMDIDSAVMANNEPTSEGEQCDIALAICQLYKCPQTWTILAIFTCAILMFGHES